VLVTGFWLASGVAVDCGAGAATDSCCVSCAELFGVVDPAAGAGPEVETPLRDGL
jgi:hypothetical protein